jgi:hypothetical protein
VLLFLRGSRAGIRQVLIARCVGSRELDRRVVGFERRARLVDQRRLPRDLGVVACYGCFCRGHVCFRAHQCGLEALVVDTHQQLAGFDRLVVFDEYVGYLAGDTRRDQREIGGYIRIVGGLGIRVAG